MLVALDFDDTYTRDPEMWDSFIDLLRQHRHQVIVVTMRYESEGEQVRTALASKVDAIYFTGRKAKYEFMKQHRINVSVWIDDNPFFICYNALG